MSSTSSRPAAALALKPLVFTGARGGALPYRLHRPPTSKPGVRHPLVLFLHGAGERGSDNQAQLVHGVLPLLEYAASRGEKLFLVAPQCPAEEKWVDSPWNVLAHTMPARPSASMQLVLGLLDKLMREEAVDPDRIYVTGLSMGGYGTWDLLQRHPRLFAAGIPICGGGDVDLAGRFKNVPLWAFHGARDDVVPPFRSRAMVAALQEAGGHPGYTEYPDVGHNAWAPAYADPAVLGWLLAQNKQHVSKKGKS
jgi:predicted peptidase